LHSDRRHTATTTTTTQAFDYGDDESAKMTRFRHGDVRRGPPTRKVAAIFIHVAVVYDTRRHLDRSEDATKWRSQQRSCAPIRARCLQATAVDVDQLSLHVTISRGHRSRTCTYVVAQRLTLVDRPTDRPLARTVKMNDERARTVMMAELTLLLLLLLPLPPTVDRQPWASVAPPVVNTHRSRSDPVSAGFQPRATRQWYDRWLRRFESEKHRTYSAQGINWHWQAFAYVCDEYVCVCVCVCALVYVPSKYPVLFAYRRTCDDRTDNRSSIFVSVYSGTGRRFEPRRSRASARCMNLKMRMHA
jgi:hypothetical protein